MKTVSQTDSEKRTQILDPSSWYIKLWLGMNQKTWEYANWFGEENPPIQNYNRPRWIEIMKTTVHTKIYR